MKEANGQWRSAQNIEQLTQAFRAFLGLARWEALDDAGATLQAELGHPLEVPPGGYTVRIDGHRATESNPSSTV